MECSADVDVLSELDEGGCRNWFFFHPDNTIGFLNFTILYFLFCESFSNAIEKVLTCFLTKP